MKALGYLTHKNNISTNICDSKSLEKVICPYPTRNKRFSDDMLLRTPL
jgi:hypothetical protein